MLGTFESLKSVIKISEINIDNIIFRLHYKLTFLLFIVCSILVSLNQYFGDPILCVFDKSLSKHEKILNNYCWIHSTFTLPKTWTSAVGKEVAAKGLGTKLDGDEVKLHKYYQWVCIVLFLQAFSFYIPRYLWKSLEQNRMKQLTINLRYSMIEYSVREKHQEILINYLKQYLHSHHFYAIRYFICELLNFLNAILQTFLIHLFLNKEFYTYGIDVLTYTYRKYLYENHSYSEYKNLTNPSVRVFPMLTKCEFFKYGPSGDIQNFDGLCVLALNVVNEKVYLVIWFWMIFLIFISGMQIVYRIFICILPSFRYQILRRNNRLCDYKKLKYLNNQLDIGDWFIFRQLGKNINALSYNEIVIEFVDCLKREYRGIDDYGIDLSNSEVIHCD